MAWYLVYSCIFLLLSLFWKILAQQLIFLHLSLFLFLFFFFFFTCVWRKAFNAFLFISRFIFDCAFHISFESVYSCNMHVFLFIHNWRVICWFLSQSSFLQRVLLRKIAILIRIKMFSILRTVGQSGFYYKNVLWIGNLRQRYFEFANFFKKTFLELVIFYRVIFSKIGFEFKMALESVITNKIIVTYFTKKTGQNSPFIKYGISYLTKN